MYFLEKLPHLKLLKLWFFPDTPINYYKPLIQPRFIVFANQCNNPNDFFKICFDIEIDPKLAKLSIINSNCYYFIAPFKIDPYLDESDDFPTSDELTLAYNDIISCRFCNNTIVTANYGQSQNIEKIYPLPSEYWLELCDIWFCCAQHHLQFAPKDIKAKIGKLLIGKLHIVIHPSNLIKDSYIIRKTTPKQQSMNESMTQSTTTPTISQNLKIEEISEEKCEKEYSDIDDMKMLNCHCARCDTLLGVMYASNDDKSVPKECHLWKFELLSSPKSDTPNRSDEWSSSHLTVDICNANRAVKLVNTYHWYNAENFIAAKILEINSAKLTHKFVICDLENTVFIRLNLLSQKCFVKTPLIFNDSQISTMAPAIKVTFNIQTNTSKHTFENNEQWVTENNGEFIYTATENVWFVGKRLIAYHSALPTMISEQSFGNGMKLGYLRMLSKAVAL